MPKPTKSPTPTKTRLHPPGLKSVVVAVDFSPGSTRALERAGWLSFASDAVVRLVHVMYGNAPRPLAAEIQHRADELLTQAASRFTRLLRSQGAGHVQVKVTLLSGQPIETIAKFVKRHRADLVLVGRHGQSVSRLLIGSVAERLGRTVAAPVLIVGQHPTKAYLKPLLAVEGKKDASLVVKRLAGMMGAGGTNRQKLDVVHGVETPLSGWLLHGMTKKQFAGYLLNAVEEASQKLSQVKKLAAKEGFDANLSVQQGDARVAILQTINKKKSDVVALASHCRTGFGAMMLGSVSTEVMRMAKCDVLMVPFGSRR